MAKGPDGRVTADEFYLQMRALQARKVVYLDDYDPTNTEHVVVTFDGIYTDVFDFALPILEQLNYPFELFVIGDMIGSDNALDPSLAPPCHFANLTELDRLVDAGGRVQWHTRTHKPFSQMTLEQAELELDVPSELRQRYPSPHLQWLAFPNGETDARLKGLVGRSFAGALACDDGRVEDRFNLPRRSMLEKDSLFKGSVAAIVANYNYGAFLREAVESLERQISKPDEILIIDDASSDDSGRVLGELAERGYRVVRNERNLGIVENFRKAISLVSSEYTFFLGADNRLRSDFVLECRLALDREPQAAVAYTDVLLFGPLSGLFAENVKAEKAGHCQAESSGVFHWRFPDPEGEALTRFDDNNFVHGSSMYRRSWYDRVGGYRKTEGPEDHNLFLRMWKAGGKLVHVREPVLEYRQHSRVQPNNALIGQTELRRLRTRAENLQSHAENLQARAENLESRLNKVTLDLKSERNEARIARLKIARLSQSYVSRFVAPLRRRFDFLRNADQRKMLASIGPIFDRHWYRSVYDDVRRFAVDPLEHFVSSGAAEGRDPGPLFSTSWYNATYPDVEALGMSPVIHFVECGAAEGRDPHPLFSTSFYKESYPEAGAGEINPLIYYLKQGAALGHDPNPLFLTQWYAEKNLEGVKEAVNPLVHFTQSGARNLLDPHPLFSTKFYTETYGDKLSGVNPLADFLLNGASEKRDPNPIFSTAWYLATYPDVAASGMNPLFHYIRLGAKLGYDPSPVFSTNWYWTTYPGITPERNPLEHYLSAGIAERRRGSPNFDPEFYMGQNGLPTVERAYHHYNQEGRSTGRLRTIADARSEAMPASLRGPARITAKTRLRVGVVLYNNTKRQVEQIFSSATHAIAQCGPGVEGEVYFLDNSDRSEKTALPAGSHVLRSDKNEGFGAGHNTLMKAAFDAGADVYLGVNPDGAFHPDSIARLLMLNVEKQGRAMIEAQQFPEEHFKCYDPETLRTRWLSGACFLLPRAIFEAIGGFDEKIFLYCEDVDLSWRAQRSGFETLHCPAALFYHDVSDRGGDDAWRYSEMLVSGRYLAHKWNCPKFKAWCETELLKAAHQGPARELPTLHDVQILDDYDRSEEFEHHFSFSPVRPIVNHGMPGI